MNKLVLGHNDIRGLVDNLASQINKYLYRKKIVFPLVYPIPRGGVTVAYRLLGFMPNVAITDKPVEATFFVDDLIDSGMTCKCMYEQYPDKPFFTLIDKRTDEHYKDKWIVFPWEQGREGDPEENIVRLLQFIGEDPTREGLRETPARVIKAWKFWTKGYTEDPSAILKTFVDGSEGVEEMVVVRDIPFFSNCEHHMAPFFGTATVAYLPDKRIVGLSKINRLVEAFARRLQVQERLTCNIADALMEHLTPLGCGVVIKARHMCVESRGVQHRQCVTLTSALRGIFKTDPTVRSEFLELAKDGREL